MDKSKSDESLELRGLRESIDRIDGALVLLLAERFHITEKVGHYKSEHRLPAEDSSREAAQSLRIRELCEQAGLDYRVASKIFSLILEETKERHRLIAREYREYQE